MWSALQFTITVTNVDMGKAVEYVVTYSRVMRSVIHGC